MCVDSDTLLPPLPVIRERLSKNQRERRVLRAMLRLALAHPEQTVASHASDATPLDHPSVRTAGAR